MFVRLWHPENDSESSSNSPVVLLKSRNIFALELSIIAAFILAIVVVFILPLVLIVYRPAGSSEIAFSISFVVVFIVFFLHQ